LRYQLRDSSSAYRFEDDGSVTLIVWRRERESTGGWRELTFNSATIPKAEKLYDRYCLEGVERSKKQAARRARWGPLEVSRPA
jgi:hypothetical protein